MMLLCGYFSVLLLKEEQCLCVPIVETQCIFPLEIVGRVKFVALTDAAWMN